MVALWRHGCRAVGSGLTEVLCILVEFLRKHPEFQNLSSKVSVEISGTIFETLVFVAFFIAIEAVRARFVRTSRREHFCDVKCTYGRIKYDVLQAVR